MSKRLHLLAIIVFRALPAQRIHKESLLQLLPC